MNENVTKNALLELLVELIDIPTSYYEKATKRYESLGEWFHRDGSSIRHHDPAVSPQGSFRLGTVIRPFLRGEEYDLDLVCMLALLKSAVSQKQLKELVGAEVKAYAEAKGVKAPVLEGNRCWRLDYADEVLFHMDILPSIPQDEETKARFIAAGVPPELAAFAIAITDQRHPGYAQTRADWFGSNPKGYAGWFEGRMREVAQTRLEAMVSMAKYASVDDVPTFEWKTPLQRCVQLLKRHRDVMFHEDPDGKPISIIISTLAARAYSGDGELLSALSNITERMTGYVSDQRPRVANPVDPSEDFADRWALDPRLEQNFWDWHHQVGVDLERLLSGGTLTELQRLLERSFGVTVGEDRLRAVAGDLWNRSEGGRSAAVIIKDAPSPWRCE